MAKFQDYWMMGLFVWAALLLLWLVILMIWHSVLKQKFPSVKHALLPKRATYMWVGFAITITLVLLTLVWIINQ